MTTSSISHSALQFALAALANSGEGGGGGEGGTVKVRVVSTITGAPGTRANVVNLGTDTDVLLQFTIPEGEQGERGDPGEKGDTGDVYLFLNGTFLNPPQIDTPYAAESAWFNRTYKNGEFFSGFVTEGTNVYYVTGEAELDDSPTAPVTNTVTFSKVAKITGSEGKPGSQWFTSDAEPGTAIEGAVDGDMILYKEGEVYKVVDGAPADTGIDLIPPGGTGMNPYEYALSIGFVGTKTEFDMRFLASLKDVATDTITSGGTADSSTEPDVIVDGGIGGKKNYEMIMSGNNEFSD